MLSYVLKFIRKNKGIFAFTILAFFTISLVVPLALSAIYTSRALVNDDISKYSRGTYDLLIRSEKSISKVEKEMGLVEENYLAAGYGGISIEQYNKIKTMQGVEAAAPVAAIGYFTSSHNSITASFPYGKSYHINAKVYTYDGIKDYLLDSQDYYQIASNFKENDVTGEPVVFFPESVQGYSNARGKIEYPIMLPQVWDMLVAIDFNQENKLMGLEKYVTSGTYNFDKKINDIDVTGIKGREIPILINENAFVPMKITINYEQYNIDRNQGDITVKNIVNTSNFESAYLLNNSLKEKLDLINGSSLKSKTSDLSKYLNPFKTTMINLKEDGQTLEQVKSGAAYNEAQGSLYYRASPISYKTNLENLIAQAVGEKNGIPLFRNMEQVGSDINQTIKNNETINQFKVYGTIKTPEAESGKLSGSPLGMYGDSYAALYEENKNTEDLKKIYPTTEPGSFVPSAPKGYTSLEALKYLKSNDPIDAIRVRVSGINKYDNAAKAKIEKIAAEINEETGLHVDVVAGSSNRNIVVSINGIQSSNLIGKVVERWTTLGTAALIVKSWSTTSGVLVILFMLCGFLFIINRINCSISGRQGEISTLKALGWENKHICKVLSAENLIAALISVTLSAAAIFIINKFYSIKFISIIFIISSIVFLILAPLSAYVYSGILEKKSSMTSIKLADVSLKRPFENTSIERMILNNISAYIKRSQLLIVQIGLSGGLGVYTYLTLKATENYISATALGEKINTTTSPMISVLIIGSMLMVIFTVVDRFSTIIMERKAYIGTLRALGWKEGHIIRLIIGEALILSLIGTLFAVILSLTGFKLMYTSYPVSLSLIFVIFVILIMTAVLSAFYPMYRALKISPLDAVMSRDTRTKIKDNVSKKTVYAFISSFMILALILSISVFYVGTNKSKPAYKDSNSLILNKISDIELKQDLEKIKDFDNIGSFIKSKAEALGFQLQETSVKLDKVIGIKENSIKITIGSQVYTPEKIYVNSGLAAEGKVSIKKQAIVLGKSGTTDIKNKILIVDNDSSEEEMLKDWNKYKDASAIVILNNLIDNKDVFETNLSYEGVVLAEEKQGKNMIIDIPGKEKGSIPYLIQVGIGDLTKEDNSSAIVFSLQLLKMFKDEKPTNSIRLLFTCDSQLDYSRALRQYLEKNKVKSVFCIGRIGTGDNIIFGVRDDTSFGKPTNMDFGDNYIQGIARNIEFIDKSIPYLYHINNIRYTEDEEMRKAQSIAKSLNINLNPSNDNNYSGFACIDNKIDFSYVVSPEKKIVEANSFKKQIVMLYRIMTE